MDVLPTAADDSVQGQSKVMVIRIIHRRRVPNVATQAIRNTIDLSARTAIIGQMTALVEWNLHREGIEYLVALATSA